MNTANLPPHATLNAADCFHTVLRPSVASTSAKILAIGGNDVMTCLGIMPGPAVEKVLISLLESVTDNSELNTRESLFKLARKVPL